MAGKRKGTDDERYLWGEMLRAIQEIKPTFVIAENVFGITNIDGGLVFEQVCLDLEAEGYEVQPFVIPAAAKNAPHRRDRVWFVAQNTMLSRCVHGESQQERAEVRQQRDTGSRSSERIHLSEGNATDTERIRLEYCTTPGQISGKEKNANGERCKSTLFTKANDYGYKSNWDNFPTKSPICSGDDGLPTELDAITFSKWRAESIKGYGNAIVPQIALEIFKQLEKIYLEL